MSGPVRARELMRRLATLGAEYRQTIAGGRLDALAAIDQERLQLAAELRQLRESTGQSLDQQDPALAELLSELERDSACICQLLISLKDELHQAIKHHRQMSRGLAGYNQATTHQV